MRCLGDLDTSTGAGEKGFDKSKEAFSRCWCPIYKKNNLKQYRKDFI